MTSSARIFSLPMDTQQRLEKFIQNAERNGLRVLVAPDVSDEANPEPLDVSGLRRSDYKKLYENLGVQVEEHNYNQAGIRHWLNAVGGDKALSTFHLMKQLKREARQRRQPRRGPRPLRNGHITVSGAVTALLTLGMDLLEERSRREITGSKDTDADRPEAKRLRPSARKAAAA